LQKVLGGLLVFDSHCRYAKMHYQQAQAAVDTTSSFKEWQQHNTPYK